ncbi:MAG: AraC family transcriptional regulator [Clostridia bacterium]|nr:AraC family transcriptional regulator [Clostridia bacterium]
MYKKNGRDVYHKATEFMKENLFEKLHVIDIAEHCGVSASGLEKYFAEFGGIGVMRQFLDLKLDKAAKMLKEGYTVNYLAKLLNFSSSAHLSMAFKKKYGVSPLKYKYPFVGKVQD